MNESIELYTRKETRQANISHLFRDSPQGDLTQQSS